MPCNFFITGEKGKGKSFLIRRFMEEWDGKIQGFLTLPYMIRNRRKGFYLHSLQEVAYMENDLPISVQYGTDVCFPVTEAFECLGCAALEQALESGDMVVMDEIGILEGQAFRFQQTVKKVLDSENLTLCAIKKADTPFLCYLRNRKDVILFDLDVNTSDRIYANMVKEMDRIRKRG